MSRFSPTFGASLALAGAALAACAAPPAGPRSAPPASALYHLAALADRPAATLPAPRPVPAATPMAGVGDPGPLAIAGLILNNGQPAAGIQLALVLDGHGRTPLVTDARGIFRADHLQPGTYHVAYYNPTDRNKIGFWRSRPRVIDGGHGAAWPAVDLFLKGMINTPAMNTHVPLPASFEWQGPLQPVKSYFFRIHSMPYTHFDLVYQSAKLDGAASRYAWDGSHLLVGPKLDPHHRYFWGVKWDWAELGEGGNLYQPVYLQSP